MVIILVKLSLQYNTTQWKVHLNILIFPALLVLVTYTVHLPTVDIGLLNVSWNINVTQACILILLAHILRL